MRRTFFIALAATAGLAMGAAMTQGGYAQTSPRAYVVAEIEVTDPATFQKYGDETRTSIPAAGGRVIARGGRTFIINGAPPKQIVLIEWDSLEKAQAFFGSEAYKQLVPIRDRSSNFRAFAIEGVAR
jgi:uncharacterized protein (DUF1330 family)